MTPPFHVIEEDAGILLASLGPAELLNGWAAARWTPLSGTRWPFWC